MHTEFPSERGCTQLMTDRRRLQNLIRISLFTALLAILSQMALPLPSGIPLTLQTFAVALCGFMLGMKGAAYAVTAYLLLGAAGLPVFAGFHGGVGVLFGMSGGFLLGFVPLAVLCGTKKIPLAALGLLLCHGLGILQFSLVTGTSAAASAATVSLPFLLKDAASVVAAHFAARAIGRGLSAAHLS